MKNKKQFYIRHMLFSSLLPSFISAIALAFADIADAVVVGNKIGESGLAAIGIVCPVYMIYNILGYGLSVGGEVVNSRLAAAGKNDEANKHFNMVLWTGVFWGVILAAVGLVFYRQFLFVLGAEGQEAELFRLCSQYYIPLIAAAPLFIANYILYDLLRSDEDPQIASTSFTAGCIVDLGLNVLFVIGFGWGVSGSIAATIVAQTVTFLISMVHFVQHRGILTISKPLISIRGCFSAFRIGASSSVRYLFEFLFLTVANNLLIRYAPGDGASYVAVLDVVMNVSYVGFALYEGTGAAIQPLAAAFFEEKDRPSLDYILKNGTKWGMICGTVIIFLIGVCARPVSVVFGLADTDILRISVPAIRIFCCSVPMAGFILILINFFLSVDKENLSAALTFIRSFLVLLPLTFLFGRFFPEYFWVVFPLTEAVSLVLTMVGLRSKRAEKLLKEVPVMSVTLENDNHEIAELLEQVERFCEENGASAKQANLLQMAVEEICMTTILKAFTGDAREYIQVTLVRGEEGRFTLLIRNSAQRFNPFDMKMGKVTREAEEEFLDSMGILVIKRKAEKFYYRRSEIFNVLTVEI